MKLSGLVKEVEALVYVRLVDSRSILIRVLGISRRSVDQRLARTSLLRCVETCTYNIHLSSYYEMVMQDSDNFHYHR